MTTTRWRRWIRATIAVISIASFGVAAGCGSSEASPADQAAGQTAEQATGGAAVYAAHCASCHGADLRGTDKGPSQLSIVYEPNHHPDQAFRSAVINGAPQHHWNFGAMAPITGLSDAEIDSVIAYVRAEQQRLGFEQ